MRPALTTTDASGGEREAPSLLCIDGDRSFTLRIPASGELVLGRGPEVGFAVDDPLVSRNHARILLGPDGLRIEDLGSRHGTLVNGERIAEPRALRPGDVAALGGTLLIARRAAPVVARTVVDHAGLVQRLAGELARCVGFERELSVIVFRGVPADQLADRVRTIDTIAPIGSHHVAVLAPELDRDEALAFVQPLARFAVGIATAPFDGIDADALVAGARAACDAGEAGVRRAADAAMRLSIGAHRIVVADPTMARLYELAERVARSQIPVLVQGETGSGKELAAATVHARSQRASGPFVSVNCAAIPESLAESELFGHVKGAFSGALANKVGYVEAAAGGTLFLDEIGELSPVLQAKLLRVLETGELVRVGEVKPRTIDLRIVAATNRNLQREVDEGRFRQDLYFRLGAARLEIPPLRERPRDLAILIATQLAEACRRLGRAPLELSIGAAIALHGHDWPGNVRELRHAIDYAAAAAPDGTTELELWHLPPDLAAAARRERDGVAPPASPVIEPAPGFRPIADEVRDLERARMVAALRASDGVQNRAAALIEMPLRTFVTKLKRYAISPHEWK